MQTTGTVFKINSTRGMIAVQVDSRFSVFELLGSEEFEVGDVVSWSEHSPLGSATVRNRSRSFQAEVHFQMHEVPLASLDGQLRLR